MGKIIIMQGLPGSGKSTRAQEIMERDGNCVRVGRDQLRTMLHFDKFNGKNEGITRDVQKATVEFLLKKGKVVIIDDTNVQAGRIQAWKDFAKEHNCDIQWERVETPIEECIKRDAAREKPVGKNVIVAMAMQAGLYPKPEKGFVICDLDGTLCDIEHRRHFVKVPEGQKKDWKGFFANISGDAVNEKVRAMIEDAQGVGGYEIAFVSGRPDDHREVTERWLQRHVLPYSVLLMRRAGDKRPDTETKKDILDTYFLNNGYKVAYAIDDRPSVIRMWAENGISVVDVGDGIEF